MVEADSDPLPERARLEELRVVKAMPEEPEETEQPDQEPLAHRRPPTSHSPATAVEAAEE